MNPKAVVFDIGGVLIDWNPAYLYRQLLPDDQAVQQFLNEVCTTEWNQQFDAGVKFADGIAALLETHPEKAELITAYWERWHDMLGGEISGTVKILQQLRQQGVPVHAISNWSSETYPRAMEIFPFLADFETLIVSGREKLIKPDQAIFELFLERSGLAASDCIFIDDNTANIATAQRLGFHTEHFTDPEKLEKRLTKLGFLHNENAFND